jgi:probable HAF family extracellular repeat protein
MSDLNDLIESGSGWTLSQAWGINDNGQIVGFGQSPSLQTHAFLLTPRPSLQNLRFIGGQAQFDLSGMTGVTYRVEYSLALPTANWLALTNVVLPSSPTPIVDTSLSPATHRFYRAVQP